MSRKRAVKKPRKENMGCENCLNCIPIGDGDHICNELIMPAMVIDNYLPTEDYFKCGGDSFET